jgi:uncharacterized membrane protein
MSVREQLIAEIKLDLAHARARLADLECRETVEHNLQDITQTLIDEKRREISVYEKIVASLDE